MSDRRRDIEVSELDTCVLTHDELTRADLDVLDGLRANDRLLTREDTRAGHRLRFNSAVGVLTLDRVRLTIRPKFLVDGRRLITWLQYAQAAPTAEVATARRWETTATGLPDLITTALVAECRALLRHGLRRDYRATQQVDTVLRGRLDYRAQVTRRFGMLDKLHLDTHQRADSVWENLVCGVALRRAARLSSAAPLKRAARELAERFPRAPSFDRAAAMHRLRRAEYHRMNAHYRNAHGWAGLVLGGGGVHDLLVDQGLPASSLLLKTYRLWERVVQRLVADAAALRQGDLVRPTGAAGIHVADQSRYGLPVDALVRWHAGNRTTHLPVDAKYKACTSLDRNDIHQMLTYATAYAGDGEHRVVVVHPSERGTSNRSVDVDGPHGLVGRIDVHGVDTEAPPELCVRHLADSLTA